MPPVDRSVAEQYAPPETVKLADYHALQAITFLADPEICFDVGSIDYMNRILDNYLRQLIELSGKQMADGETRCLNGPAVEAVLRRLNVKTSLE